MPRAQFPRRGRGQREFYQFIVGLVQAPAYHHAPRELRGKAYAALAVGETVHGDFGVIQAGSGCQVSCGVAVIRKTQQ